MVEKGEFNSRMKDFYDLYRIVIAHHFDEEVLMDAIVATFNNRNTDLTTTPIIFRADFASNPVFNQRWNAFCTKIKMPEAPTFSEVMRIIIDFITPYWEKLQGKA
jgi:hypothetical protein